MSHELMRLSASLYNTPQFITQESFETVFDYLDQRNVGMFKESGERGENLRYNYNKDLQVATLNVEGLISRKPVTMFGMDCGGFSYEQFKEDFHFLAESGVRTVAFMQDSGGGHALGCFDACRYVRSLADEHGIHLISFVDGVSASASYAISAIADEVIMTEGSSVGSIGCVVRLMNNSKALEKEGLERTFITSASSKVPFAKDGSFEQDFLDGIQEEVNIMGAQFVSFVSEHRGITEEDVRATNAKTFMDVKAVELGLADRVMDVESFYTYLADASEHNRMEQPQADIMKNKLFNKKELSVTDTTTVEMQAELTALQAQHVDVQAQLSAATASLAEMTEVLATKEQAYAEAVATLEAMTQEKEETKVAMRKQKLSAVVAEDQVEGVAASLSALDEDAFETVLAGFAAQQKVVEESSLMDEIGSSFAAEQEEVGAEPELSSTDKAILARLGVSQASA